MINLIAHHKAESFLWIYISDYQSGKIEKAEANALIAAMFGPRLTKLKPIFFNPFH